MEKYITSLSTRNPNKNEGYSWVLRESVYIPIVKTCLSITKRSSFLLPLLDEMTLRLVAEGINEIEQIAKILGIGRRLLDITIADLYTKNLVYCSAGRCTLRPQGREVLRQLKVIRRQKDVIKNVYYDPINQSVLADYQGIQFVDQSVGYDNKLEAEFDVKNIDIFRDNIEVINTIFLDEMNIYNDKTKAEPDELLSIDSIEKIFVRFIKFPIYIYVSDSGCDIDVLPVNKSMQNIFQNYREKIIEQMRQLKLFKHQFCVYKVHKSYATLPYIENMKIKEIIDKHKGKKWGLQEREKLFSEEILISRKLFDDEFELLLSYLCKESDSITIKVSHLDEWKNKEILKQILSSIGNEKLEKIIYSSCKQLDNCIKVILRTIPKCEKKVIQEKHEVYLQICFDDEFVITGLPINITILEDDIYIHKIEYYLEKQKVEAKLHIK